MRYRTIDSTAARRLLTVPSTHNSCNIHDVLPARAGMRVCFTVTVSDALDLVQEGRAAIVDFVVKSSGRDTCEAMPLARGNMFTPGICPQASVSESISFSSRPSSRGSCRWWKVA